MNSSTVKLRPLVSSDEQFLWTMLQRAAHADVSGESIDEIKSNADLTPYAENWGCKGDHGWVAECPEPVGAVWVRKIRAYGFVSEDIPELAIAVKVEHTGQGIGSVLLRAILSSGEPLFTMIYRF